MVNVQASNVCQAALAALPAELGQKFKLLFPMALATVSTIMLIPVFSLAPWFAKARFAVTSAMETLSTVLPSVGKVAGSSAILSGSALKTVGVDKDAFTTMKALTFDSIRNHAETISKYARAVKPINFQIACDRIARELQQQTLAL